MSEEDQQFYIRSEMDRLEIYAKNDKFPSKEKFMEYLSVRERDGILKRALTEEKKKQLLDLYDAHHKKQEKPLDMQDYKTSTIENQGYIVSTENNRILKTDGSEEGLEDEFKKTQNELSVAPGTKELASSDVVYSHLQNNIKEEVTLIPLNEAINRDNISHEILEQIRFFLTNNNINPNEYIVSPETGVFYNFEKNEIYKVVKNAETGKYEIKKASGMSYDDKSQTDEQIITDRDPEAESKEESPIRMLESQPKIRRRVPPKDINNQAAFAKITFLVILCIFVSLALSSLILLIK